jgi:hypothetical protein
MEEPTRLDSAVQHLKNYFETRWNLLVLNASEKASDIISSIASVFLIALCMAFVLLFLSISTALWIGNSLENNSMGFLIVALFYLVIAIVLIFFKDKLIKVPVINKILTSIYNDGEN